MKLRFTLETMISGFPSKKVFQFDSDGEHHPVFFKHNGKEDDIKTVLDTGLPTRWFANGKCTLEPLAS